MTSYFSSLLTTTTSRVASIRQNLLPTENDGDTEDDTHVCRVLRAYYTEKGRSFPAWLPPDPKAPAPVVVQPVYSQQVGSSYGAVPQSGASLSSLWDSQPAGQQQAGAPQSLRAGRSTPQMASAARNNPFARQQQSQNSSLQVEARPLPSQRAGSYQTANSFSQGQPTPPGSSAGMSASDRLKGRLRPGNRAASPASGGPASQRSNSYGDGGTSGGRNYEESFAPSGGSSRGGAERPFVAATSPWASNADEFGGGGYQAPAAPSGGRIGLPGGPRAGRGPGLPSGPRGAR